MTPLATPPAPASPSQDDRVLAGLCHVSLFIGFPVVGPLVVYAIYREKSRFVAFHSLQAAMTHLAALPLGFAGAILAMIASVVAGALAHGSGAFAPIAVMIAWGFGLGVPWLGVVAYSIYAGVRAFSGELYRIPGAAALADRVLDAPSQKR
ncbi:MAG TPA: DUF4870 domain-containing protein [Minicystis sp.]|nr:DUF4870 domain-containing protein [Minicystis sp.]